MPSSRPFSVVVSLTLSILAGCAAPAPPPLTPTPASGPLIMRLPPSPSRESPPAPLPGSAAAEREPPKSKRAALRFDLEGRPFPSPLVDAMIGGQPTTLVVDTGATHHVVSQWFARELSLPIKKAGDAGTDLTGRAVAVSRIEGASLSLSGLGAVPAPVLLVITVPEVLRKLGVGGFLSPQALVREGRAVILDLRMGSMTEAPVDEALGLLGTEPGGAPPLSLRVCGGGAGGEGSQLVATATIEGMTAEVKVDSGASHSSIFGGRGVGQKLAGRAAGSTSAYAASGKVTVPTLQGAKISLGAFEGSADIDILPTTPAAACANDGYVGMDVLRSCVIVLAKQRSAMRCATR